LNEVTVPRKKIAALEQAMRAQTPEQLQDFLDKVEMRHFYADGMYCRVCKREAGVVIVGKVHKKEHLYIVAAGSVAVTNGDDAPVIYQAGEVIVSKPGTKRAVVALEDSICMTVHRTDKTDLDEIEEELIEPDELALFDARNKLKELK
jgi:quercetin dioxygenase-like cupin family protein